MRIIRIILGLLVGFAVGVIGTIILTDLSITLPVVKSFYHWFGRVTNEKAEGGIRLFCLLICLPIASFLAGFFSAVITRFREVTIAIVVGIALVLFDIIIFSRVAGLMPSARCYWLNLFVEWLLCIVFAVLGGLLAKIIRLKYSNTSHND